MYKHLIRSLILIFLCSCAVREDGSADATQPVTDETCITQEESAQSKTELENGIRGQVKFTGEEEILNSVEEKMSEYNIPAVSLTVIHQGEIAWADIYQNPDYSEVLDCHSIFQAASLSKPVTVLAALRMHAAGEIDLDKDIQQYLEEYELPEGKQTPEHPVTFRNIFSHTSGITSGGYQGYDRALPLPSDLDVLNGAEGVNSPAIEVISTPDEMLAYSGGAYTLAELALQDIYREEFAVIMKKWILEPVGMTHSEFTQPLPESKADQVAKGHTQSGDIIESGWRNHPEQAAAGLWSTSVDMAKFLIEIYKAYHGQSTVFSQSDIESILSHERDGLAYGFIVNKSGDDIAITHYGGNAGYRTGMTISLTSGNGLVYLINSDNGGALGNELLLSAAQVYDWQHFEQMQAQRKQVDFDILQGLSGEYKWNDQIDLTVTYDENSDLISLFFPNGDAYELIPIAGDNLDFIHKNTGVKVSFADDSFILYGQTAVKQD